MYIITGIHHIPSAMKQRLTHAHSRYTVMYMCQYATLLLVYLSVEVVACSLWGLFAVENEMSFELIASLAKWTFSVQGQHWGRERRGERGWSRESGEGGGRRGREEENLQGG